MTVHIPTSGPVSRRSLLGGLCTLSVLTGLAACSDHDDNAAKRPPRGGDAQGTASTAAVEIRVDGDRLEPVVELVEGSAAGVAWVDLDSGAPLGTGIAPRLDTAGVRRVGLTVSRGSQPVFDEVTTLNLGFHRDDDYGRLSLDSAYEHDPQPVTGLGELGLLTGLVRLCAARTPMAGRLDLSGLAHLEHVECYRSEIDEVDLTGCSSLVRLVVEDCRLSDLDLGPVRGSLQDLRAAIQRSDGLTFASLDGPMESLYHYCVREQAVRGLLPHAHLPVVEEYWVWGTGQESCDAPVSPLLTSYLARDNPLDQVSVDAVLVGLAAHVEKAGRVDLSGTSPDDVSAAEPSGSGQAAADALETSGWRVATN